MKLVFLKNGLSQKGGLEKYTLFLLKAFVEKGCRVTLLTTGATPQIPGVEIISLSPSSKFSYWKLSHFDHLCKEWLKKNPHEIVFGLERNTFQTHYRAGSGVHAVYLKRRKLTDSHLKYLSFYINPLHRKILSIEKQAFESPKLELLFTNSNMVREEILSTYSTPSHKVEAVHNGVEWKKWEEDFEESLVQKRSGPFQFLFVGNGYLRKGLLFLLKGLERIKKEDFHLTVIGKDKNADFFKRCAEKLGLKDKVSFLGQQNEMRHYYKNADALVIPSIYDPFANVTIEALAMGLYVISSEYNGGKEVLKEGCGEVISELTSSDSVAESLKRALTHAKSEKSARQVRSTVKELDFSNQLEKIVCKTLKN